MNCTKAIIPVGGFGTRRLPITKAIEKCMLPVGNRPIIDYVVEDCIQAGITEFLFVIHEQCGQIRHYYSQDQLLENYLESRGKLKELEQVRALNNKARFHYVIQNQYQPYGTAVPLWLCANLVKSDEKVLVVFGDQFFCRQDGSSELADFLAQAQNIDTPAAMLANEVSWDKVEKYGIVVTKQQDGHELYEKIIEKPKREEAPTNLNNSSCYLFDHGIFPFVSQNIEQEQEDEHLLTDAINEYVQAGNQVAVIRAKGEYLDCGSVDTWMHANERILADTSFS